MTSRKGGQAGGMEDNPNVVSMVMLMRLQKEFETLKKTNEEEMSMLRTENAYK